MTDTEVRIPVHWTRREAVLYALSVGYGHSVAEHNQELPYIYAEHKSFRVAPTLPLGINMCPTQPNGAVIRPWEHPDLLSAVSFDPLKLLHGEQRIEWGTLDIPAPFAGETTWKLLGVYPIGQRAVVAYLESKIFFPNSNQLLVRCVSSIFLRDGKITNQTKLLKQPMTLTARKPKQLNLEMSGKVATFPTSGNAAALYRLNGDDNPIHIDPEAAASVGLPVPILHGLCTFGIAARCCTASEGERKLRAMGGRFVQPVLPGDVVEVRWSSVINGTMFVEVFAVSPKHPGSKRVVVKDAFIEFISDSKL